MLYYRSLLICTNKKFIILRGNFSVPKIEICTLLNDFNYCILSWGSVVKDLYVLQKKAVRIITQSNYIVHREPLCKQYGLIKLIDIPIKRSL